MQEILHISLEFKKGVGGIKAVTTGLLPALVRKSDFNISIVTPYFDVYHDFYSGNSLQNITTITHIYRGKEFKSDIFRACTDIIDGAPIYHYLIKPEKNSPVAWLFNIKDEKNMYQSFPHSEAANRINYFNGAVAVMIRVFNAHIPQFDLVHGHTWLTGLAGCLVKEFENLPKYQKIIEASAQPLNKIPHLISTVHMLINGNNGHLTSAESVHSLLEAIGLPNDFTQYFEPYKDYINENNLKQVVLSLIYADCVTTVSKGLAHEVINGKGEGLDEIFIKLAQQERLHGILNGTTIANTDATSISKLGEFAFKPGLINIHTSKHNIKMHLAGKYPNLDPSKLWFLFIGRFSPEKGMDMLPHALDAIRAVHGNFIIMGMHVTTTIKDGQTIARYQEEIDTLKAFDNVVVIDNQAEQQEVGMLFRAASQITLVLSHNEACGLPPMEGFACGNIAIAANVQGLPDSVIPLKQYPASGTGFLYEDNEEDRYENVKNAIIEAAEFYTTQINHGTIDILMQRLLLQAQKFDWDAKPANEYSQLYHKVLQQEVLTYDNIRAKFTPLPLVRQVNGQSIASTTNIPKIFQVGFNKCGTQTLHDFFWANKIRSIHYGCGKLAVSIDDNYMHNRPLISAEYQSYCGFFDMENIYADEPIYIAQKMFKELDNQYPGSKFILPVRDKAAWLNSRSKHIDIANQRTYVEVLCQQYNITKDELIDKWSQEWDKHHAEVLEHFKDRPQDLLIFHVGQDSPEKICEFFKDYFHLNPELYKHLNKTPASRLVVA
jgi:glycogen synthase